MEAAQAEIFERVPVITLRERIAKQLRDAIQNGSLKPGERLIERKLAERFGASPTAVREALIQLEAEGFIVKKPNAVTTVTQLSLADAIKIFEIREVLEVFAVEQAARNASPEQMRSIEEAYLLMLDAARSGNTRLFIERDFAWHKIIWRATGNDFLSTALERLVLPLFAFTAIRIHKANTLDLLADAESHRSLLTALEARDPTACRAALLEALTHWLNSTKECVFKAPETREAPAS